MTKILELKWQEGSDNSTWYLIVLRIYYFNYCMGVNIKYQKIKTDVRSKPLTANGKLQIAFKNFTRFCRLSN